MSSKQTPRKLSKIANPLSYLDSDDEASITAWTPLSSSSDGVSDSLSDGSSEGWASILLTLFGAKRCYNQRVSRRLSWWRSSRRC